jgi:23S rRNA (uracil1939-C5)-methyltransferase
MSRFDRPEIIHLSCTDLSFEGKGVCKDNGRVIFVDGIFPGEEGDIEITYQRAGTLFGRVVKLTKTSPDRIQPKCPVCSTCGGCEFQQYAYKAQLSYKQKKVEEQFRKIGHMTINALPTIGMESPYFYRNKIQVPFTRDNKGNVYCGFYKENTHVIVPIEKCYIEDERAEPILKAMRTLMKSMRIEPFDEDSGEGVIRYALIKTSKYFQDVMLVLVTGVDSFPSRNNFVHALVEQCPQITTVVQNINSRHTNVILGDRTKTLYGKGFIRDTLCGVNFRISAKSFYQTNPIMTEILYKTAMDFAELTPNDIVFDAYSGIGTIGMIAAKKCKKAISVEIVPEAVRDAIANAKENNILNFVSYADDASSYISKMARVGDHIDVLFMDPPRKGSDPRFLNAVKSLKPSRIVYVSCDPSTLARDVAYLSDKYIVGKIQPIDLFPQTFHVETVCELSLRNDDKH